MTSNQHGPYGQGYTRTTMVGTEGCNTARWSQSQKADPSPDRSLQLDSVKLESLVIADQHAAVNVFPGLVHTARTIVLKIDQNTGLNSKSFAWQRRAATRDAS